METWTVHYKYVVNDWNIPAWVECIPIKMTSYFYVPAIIKNNTFAKSAQLRGTQQTVPGSNVGVDSISI